MSFVRDYGSVWWLAARLRFLEMGLQRVIRLLVDPPDRAYLRAHDRPILSTQRRSRVLSCRTRPTRAERGSQAGDAPEGWSSAMDEQLEFVRLIAERLTSVGVEYMLTGSMAMASYGNPRMTRDVDIVVECSSQDADFVVRCFEEDCYINRGAVIEAIANRSMFNIIHNEWIIKADFIVRKDDAYHRTEFARRRAITVAGNPVVVAAPEDLILSKLEWARESHSELQIRDVRELLASGIALDREYLEDWAQVLGVTASLSEAGDE